MSISANSGDSPEKIPGKAHKRFVMIATLLYLIDPVRGEPTTYGLDKHPLDDSWRYDQPQKKFLDSFALICSTSGVGGETASAVCLEQGHPSGTVLRLARNFGVSEMLKDQLHDILNDLTAVAEKEKSPKEMEPVVLNKIVALTEDKIRAIIEKIRRSEALINIRQAAADIETSPADDSVASSFRQWVRDLPLLVSLNDSAGLGQLSHYVKWASRSRWVYSEQLEEAFELQDGSLPTWLKHVYKLGRYFTATKAMLKLAVRQPGVFTGIHVKAVEAPEQETFSVGDDKFPLLTVLRSITNANPMELRENLGKTWLTSDPEAKFRRACNTTLTAHAEMQLLSFYDQNPDLTPRLLFMGTSKKACYLCHEFISRHPLTIGVSASHQKIYPTWMLAPCRSTVRKTQKVLLWHISQHLEQTVVRDLQTRLGAPRRPINMDSTAGPSLTSTGTMSTGIWAGHSVFSESATDETARTDMSETTANTQRMSRS
ncbi:hypothetical protein CORC01_12645 [Colletotrichum orchidophilum]|uniref:Uncharacterized protein n=1 Tax=Colletotrichum orchidophilum TaxID=1209926 RepID=A0A1G4ASC2_9PEZI|nr:uncharacterized protein CORC01_12645 [Colletotrichum orchidophilum]OHE92064.1 hypothetical protein CORC01_12645 [Colletotrichum orchidophilum]